MHIKLVAFFIVSSFEKKLDFEKNIFSDCNAIGDFIGVSKLQEVY